MRTYVRIVIKCERSNLTNMPFSGGYGENMAVADLKSTRERITEAAERRRQKLERRRRRSGDAELIFAYVPKAMRGRKPRRTDLPMVFPGVGQFSKDAAELNSVALVRLLKRSPLMDELRAVCDYNMDWGRPREAGEAVLAYLAFVNSGCPDIQPWWRDASTDLWIECGYGGQPRYDLIRDRFLELEAFAVEDLFEASALLVREAINRSGGRIAFDLSIDCTESQTNARLHHDCGPDDNCPNPDHRVHRNRHGVKLPPKTRMLKAGSTEAAKKVRQAANRKTLDDPSPSTRDLDGVQAELEEKFAKGFVGDTKTTYYDEERKILRIFYAGHWWRCRDGSAGVRAFTDEAGVKKAWVGNNHLRVSCMGTGESILNVLEAADVQEYDLVEEVLERLAYITGDEHQIRSLSFDAGFSTKDVYLQLAQRGITGIGPYRKSKHDTTDHLADQDLYDRDGVPRCKHCGGETEFTRFLAEPKPRVWFTCARPQEKCMKANTAGVLKPIVQSLVVDNVHTDPRYLRPLWRNTPAFRALMEMGLEQERTHNNARRRYGLAGTDHLNRPKRPGRDWQQLRANGAVICDWAKILWRQGWLDQEVQYAHSIPADCTANLNPAGTYEYVPPARNHDTPYLQDGADLVTRMLAERRREGLQRPYGPAAVQDGGPARPQPAASPRNRVSMDYDEQDHYDVGVSGDTHPEITREREQHDPFDQARPDAPPGSDSPIEVGGVMVDPNTGEILN